MSAPPFIVVGPIRGEWSVCGTLDEGKGYPMLYRSRREDLVSLVLDAVAIAWGRGCTEAAFGWPDDTTKRSVRGLFALSGKAVLTPYHTVLELHPRFAMGDRVLYRAGTLTDANMVLTACRYAATAGAKHMGASPSTTLKEAPSSP